MNLILTVFENSHHQGVVAVSAPPGGWGNLLWPRQVQPQGPDGGPHQNVPLGAGQHLPADDVQLANAENDPVECGGGREREQPSSVPVHIHND